MTWSGLPRIEEVEPLSVADRAVIEEVREVLARHGALERFGLTLLHSHFDLGQGEILVETVDKSARTLTTRVLPASDAEPGATLVETSWRLDASDGQPRCLTYCYRPPNSQFHEI
jgi:hypothetical protein